MERSLKTLPGFFPSHDPATAQPCTDVRRDSTEDFAAAVDVAHSASGSWKTAGPFQPRMVDVRFGDVVAEHSARAIGRYLVLAAEQI
jgi:acyl-CoA reductase-like NAD-dependent aldehyde dehydrogenase